MTERHRSRRFTTAEIKTAFGHFGTGVAVVTGESEGVPRGFTCQSVVALSMEPTYIAFAPARSSTTWPQLRGTRAVCINILAGGQESVARVFADRGADRFAQVHWQPGRNGAPALQGVLARIEADVVDELEAGDHTIVVAEPTDFWSSQDRGPLLYYRGVFKSAHDWTAVL